MFVLIWIKVFLSQLKDESVFNTVRPFLGSVQWSNELDLDPDTLYLDSVSCEQQTTNSTKSSESGFTGLKD